MKKKVKRCVVCLYVGRKVEKLAKSRKSLMELSINTVRTRDSRKRKRLQQTSRDIYDCKLCRIAICNHIACWKEHLTAISCT